jgi:hypothetical protein
MILANRPLVSKRLSWRRMFLKHLQSRKGYDTLCDKPTKKVSTPIVSTELSGIFQHRHRLQLCKSSGQKFVEPLPCSWLEPQTSKRAVENLQTSRVRESMSKESSVPASTTCNASVKHVNIGQRCFEADSTERWLKGWSNRGCTVCKPEVQKRLWLAPSFKMFLKYRYPSTRINSNKHIWQISANE